MAIKESIEELKEIMGSNNYRQKTQRAWAVADLIFEVEDAKEQMHLVKFLIKNHGNGQIPETSQETNVPRMSDERFRELLESMEESTVVFMEGILNDQLSLDAAAKKVHQRLLELDDKEERAFFLSLIMYRGFSPYNFYRGKVKMTQEEYKNILKKLANVIEDIEKAIDGRTRFFSRSQKGEFILSKFKGLDEKEKIVLIPWLIHIAQHHPCDCITASMAISSMLDGVLGSPSGIGVIRM